MYENLCTSMWWNSKNKNIHWEMPNITNQWIQLVTGYNTSTDSKTITFQGIGEKTKERKK